MRNILEHVTGLAGDDLGLVIAVRSHHDDDDDDDRNSAAECENDDESRARNDNEKLELNCSKVSALELQVYRRQD